MESRRAASADASPAGNGRLTKSERREQARAERARRERAERRRLAIRRSGVWASVVVGVSVVAIILVLGGGTGVAFAGDIRTGGSLQSLSLPSLESGGQVDYASLRGRPLVINFFASWCPTCEAEMPAFQRVHEELGDSVGFLGIAQSDARSAAVAMAHATGIQYPTAFDAQGAFFNATGSTGMPVTIFVRPGGAIAEVHVGAFDEAALRSAVRSDFGV